METDERVVMSVLLSEVDNSTELNCRDEINPISVVPLVKDIEERGLIAPVIVREFLPGDEYESGKKYQLVAGFRRFTAYTIMKKESIPALLSNVSFSEARFLNLSENLQRSELNILEEARAVGKLVDQGYTEEEIGTKLNTSRGWAQVRSQLLRLPPEIQREAAAGIITQHQIREIFKLRDKKHQFDIVKKIKEANDKGQKMSSEDVKAEARKNLTTFKRQRSKRETIAMINHIMDTLRGNFGTRCLAWSCGELATSVLYDEILAEATRQGVPYIKPSSEQLGG